MLDYLDILSQIEPVLALCWAYRARLVVMLDLCRTYIIFGSLGDFAAFSKMGKPAIPRAKMSPS